MPISSEQISVVIQGRVDGTYTKKCIQTLRALLPHSEIIVSTWKSSTNLTFDADLVLLSNDPGGLQDPIVQKYTSNMQRILLSTKVGIEHASNPYILKIRGDMLFSSVNFLAYFDNFPKREKDYEVFKHRVIFSSCFTKDAIIDGQLVQPTPFHVSDWLAFGLSEDIRYLFDIPMPQEPQYSWYFRYNRAPEFLPNAMVTSCQYSPEQYTFYYACKKKFKNINFENHLDYHIDNINLSKRLILNNCIILDPNLISYSCTDKRYTDWTLKMSNMPKDLLRGLYTYDKFQRDYACL